MKHTLLFPFSLLLFTFLGCDYVDRRATDEERSDALYQSAMAEYAAGRLDKSIEGFDKVLKTNPGNSSARFQMACLLQDYRKDYLNAICNYREYVRIFPRGDKVSIAKERSDACERLLANELVRKFSLGGSVQMSDENARLKASAAKLTADLTKANKDIENLQSELAAAKRENERVRRMMLTGGTDEVKGKTEAVQSVEVPADEKSLLDDEGTTVDRVKFSADVANLIAEEKNEPVVSPFGKTVKPVSEPKAKNDAPQLPSHEPCPETYEVQEGDTLMKLAVRFYGRRSAWEQIRDANKAIVSSDGRIKAGQVLKMPKLGF